MLISSSRSGLEQNLYRPVLLLLEDLVAVRPLLQRQAMCGEALHPQRIAVPGEQRHNIVHPALDVRLSHRELDLLVKEGQHGKGIGLSTVDADERERPPPAYRMGG